MILATVEIRVKRPSSLSLRLTLYFSAAATGILLLFGWIIGQITVSAFDEANSSELHAISEAVMEAIATDETNSGIAALAKRFDDILIGHHEASLFILEETGAEIYRGTNTNLDRGFLEVADLNDLVSDESLLVEYRGTSYRVLSQRIEERAFGDETLTIISIVPIDSYLKFVNDFRRTLWLLVITSILLMSLIGWIVARQGHSPLREIVEQIGRIGANHFGERLSPEAMPYELIELAESFNEMVARIDDAFRRLSDFSANMAHELRTPVANMMTQTQVALTRSRSVEEYRDVLYSNIEEYDRMATTIRDMLFLAKADHGIQPGEAGPVDIAAQIGELIDHYKDWADEGDVVLSLRGDAVVNGDESMLQRAFSNLLSNSIKHATPGTEVVVSLHVDRRQQVTISIENQGAEIPPEQLPKLFDRFHRVTTSSAKNGDGVGLGLAIVKSIVDAHIGQIRVTSENSRTRFVVLLPAG